MMNSSKKVDCKFNNSIEVFKRPYDFFEILILNFNDSVI